MRISRFVPPLVAVSATLGLLTCAGTASARAAASSHRAQSFSRLMTVQPVVASPKAKLAVDDRANIAAITSHHSYAHEPVQNALPLSTTPVPIPTSFLGLSMEYWELPEIYSAGGAFSRLVNMLKVPGGGPVVLRIGGDSADTTEWVPDGQAPAPWAVNPITPAWVRETSRVLTRTGMHTIIDLNGIAHDQQAAASWAQEAERALPAGSIDAFEIGNEPNLYATSYGEPVVSDPATLSALNQYYGWGAQLGYTVNSYIQEWQAYEAALQQVVPGVPLAGPATTSPTAATNWPSILLGTANTNLGDLTTHLYPLSDCAVPGSRSYPNSEQSLLSPLANAQTTANLIPFVQAAHSHGVRAVITETNSVTCGGTAQISSSFATALWAANAMLDEADSGVDAINVHVRMTMRNPAFVVDGDQVQAKPLMYGLAFFARALAPNETIMPLTASNAPASNPGAVHAWLLKTTSGFRVVIVNDNDRSATVRVKIPAEGVLQEQLLQSKNLAAQTATLAGQSISTHGTWTGQPHFTAVTYNAAAGSYLIRVPAYTASLSIPVP